MQPVYCVFHKGQRTHLVALKVPSPSLAGFTVQENKWLLRKAVDIMRVLGWTFFKQTKASNSQFSVDSASLFVASPHCLLNPFFSPFVIAFHKPWPFLEENSSPPAKL